MKLFLSKLRSKTAGNVLAVFFLCAINLARAADTNLPPQLTVDLRDGSRIVGSSVEKYFKFHSALLGDLKLEVKDLRSVECVSSNVTKIVTANGDNLDVSFLDREVAVNTSFGKVELAVKSIHRLTVGNSAPYPDGLVGFWSAQNGGKDSIGGHDAVLNDVIITNDVTGPAFLFNGTTSYLRIAPAADLNVGANRGFTLEVWANPTTVSLNTLFEWNNDGAGWGVHFYINPDPATGSLYANIVDSHGAWHPVNSFTSPIVTNTYQLMAVTYDKNSGEAGLYCNGTVIGQQNVGSFIPLTTWPLYIGRRLGPDSALNYAGQMDKVAIFNRALSADEIMAAYNNGR